MAEIRKFPGFAGITPDLRVPYEGYKAINLSHDDAGVARSLESVAGLLADDEGQKDKYMLFRASTPKIKGLVTIGPVLDERQQVYIYEAEGDDRREAMLPRRIYDDPGDGIGVIISPEATDRGTFSMPVQHGDFFTDPLFDRGLAWIKVVSALRMPSEVIVVTVPNHGLGADEVLARLEKAFGATDDHIEAVLSGQLASH